VTRCDIVETLAGGDVAPGRGKKGDDVSWVDTNLTGPKDEKNSRDRFNCYKWTIKIYSNNELI
jgi:hypothetical protein